MKKEKVHESYLDGTAKEIYRGDLRGVVLKAELKEDITILELKTEEGIETLICPMKIHEKIVKGADIRYALTEIIERGAELVDFEFTTDGMDPVMKSYSRKLTEHHLAVLTGEFEGITYHKMAHETLTK